MKFEPLFENISVGFPFQAMKCQRADVKASVVRSDTGARCTALTVNETKTHNDALMMTGLQV